MTKLTFSKRVWIVKQYEKGTSASTIALAQRINRSAVYQVLEKFKDDGWDSLKDHKTGRPETSLNKKAEEIILDLRRHFGYGACHIEEILKKRGISISHRQIERLLVRNNLVLPNIKKQRPRKWVRYELPNPNDLWHTDWSYDPFTNQNISIYIDDRTRLITSCGSFKNANAENSIALLKTGIAEYGKPKAIMTDHGSTYYANYPGAEQQNTQFRITLDVLGIKHYLARINRPQTNGKVERWFGTYKTEYISGNFKSINDFVAHYNTKRLHMSLGYKTPLEVWNELKGV